MASNIEEVIKVIGTLSAVYLFLQFFIPMIQNFAAQGTVGLLLVIIMIWWLFQKAK